MDTEQIKRERELFERHLKRRAPGVNLQRIGDSYADLDVQLHFDTWLARADLATTEAEPVATLPPDPLDERDGPWRALKDWERPPALPRGARPSASQVAREADERDRRRRDEVAVALGLMRNADFSWDALLQKIRECSKASGHEYRFTFRLER